VLPHAIANRLAKRALEAIPKSTLVQTFLNSGSERLIKSFTRRLSYLHDCDTAREIAKTSLPISLPFDKLGFGDIPFDHAVIDPPGEPPPSLPLYPSRLLRQRIPVDIAIGEGMACGNQFPDATEQCCGNLLPTFLQLL
jgi:hypothetical protein